MRIEGPSRRTPVGGKSGARGNAAGRPLFELGDSQPSSRAVAPQAASAATEIDAILALQAVEDPVLKKRKAVKRGHALLDDLEALKADLLVGMVSESRLESLLIQVRHAREQIDPKLDAIVEDIELRALVELAKRGRYAG